jgi:hypothetical protein
MVGTEIKPVTTAGGIDDEVPVHHYAIMGITVSLVSSSGIGSQLLFIEFSGQMKTSSVSCR